MSRHYRVLRQLHPIPALAGDLDTNFEVSGLRLDAAEESTTTILSDIFPSKCSLDFIEKWENIFNIVSDTTKTLTERRTVVVAARRAVGGLSKPYFYNIAAGIGYNVYPSTVVPYLHIIEGSFNPFRAGYGRAGIDAIYDQSSGASQYTVVVQGSAVSTNEQLKELFNTNKPAWVEFVFEDV